MTMTPEEVYKQMSHDIYDTLRDRITRACLRWQRYLRKRTVSSTQSIAQSLQLQAGRQQYLIIFTWHPAHHRTNEVAIYAMVRTDEHMYYVCLPKHPDDPYIDAYTDHFIRRYAERLHLPMRDLPSIHGHYLLHNSCELGIYCDDKDHPRDVAFMVPDGLELGRVFNSHWIIRRTFVTLDLLKPEQREAFRTIMPAYEAYADRMAESARQGEYSNFDPVYDYIEDRFDSEFNETQNIYAQFFED